MAGKQDERMGQAGRADKNKRDNTLRQAQGERMG